MCRIAIPSAESTNVRSTGPTRPPCWICIDSHVPVGTPQARYQPSASVIADAVRSV
jgi:hypothetical protein